MKRKRLVHIAPDISSVAYCGFDPSYKPWSEAFKWSKVTCPRCLKHRNKK